MSARISPLSTTLHVYTTGGRTGPNADRNTKATLSRNSDDSNKGKIHEGEMRHRWDSHTLVRHEVFTGT